MNYDNYPSTIETYFGKIRRKLERGEITYEKFERITDKLLEWLAEYKRKEANV